MIKHASLLMAGCLVATTSFSDLIFSEYIEGSSNNKALEVMNTGTESVDLSQFTIELYSNGNTTVQNQTTLSGSLAAGDVYVLANSSAVADILDVADTTSSVTYFNGNDVLLLKQAGVVVDRIGQLGSSDYYGSNTTLVRKAEIVVGDTDYLEAFDPSDQWDAHPSNTFTYLGNGDGGPTEPPALDLTCADPATLISAIQGNSNSSPLEGDVVEVHAVVVADLQDSSQLSGFFLQEQDADADGDPQTSEGLFVYHSSTDVTVGDVVIARGEVDEFYGLTQLTNVSEVLVCDTAVLPTAASVQLPVSDFADFESVESMSVIYFDTLTVNEVYNLGRYGEFVVSQGRRFTPTDIAAPGAEADAIADLNARNVLIVDDGIRYQNPDPIVFPFPELSADNPLRVGDTLNNLTGVVLYSYGAYKLIPTIAPAFNGDNARQDSPAVVDNSDLRLASFNVLNYFNGDGFGGGFPTPRGADTLEEFERQETKIVTALVAINADIVGLMEIENDGFGTDSSVASLVSALNAQLPLSDQYDYVQPSATLIGDDAIAVGIIYKTSKVQPVNAAKILSSANSPTDEFGEPLFIDNLNRPALLQNFATVNSGESISVVVNHFKSKGSGSCDNYNDCDVGQGAYNLARTSAAQALALWLADETTGNTVILGDLNAYRQEDPINALRAAGYQSVSEDEDYSYVFYGQSGNLDHALVSSDLADAVVGHQVWHINADEPKVLDYNVEYKSEAQISGYYAPTPFRSSDHDPAIIDLKLNEAPTADFVNFPFLFWHVFISTSTDMDGSLVSHTWQIGDNTFEGALVLERHSQIRSHKIQDASLTVTDDDGAQASVTLPIDNRRKR